MSAARPARSGYQQTIARALLAITVVLCPWLSPRALAFELKLWPLIEYRSDGRTAERSLHLLGPLFAYESDGGSWWWALRPLLYRAHTARRLSDELGVLYPLSMMRWNAQETTFQLFGLFSYQTRRASARAVWDRRLTLFPFFFYRRGEATGTSVALLPFYADAREFFGYQRVRTFLFPLYLNLREPLEERSWAPFPFVSWVGGRLGRGLRVWPLYGWERVGGRERSRYLLWPLYVRRELHYERPEREQHLIIGPYAAIDTPTLRSRAFLGVTHTVDTKARTDTWGFPWPLWLSQRDLVSGERRVLRLAPFYQDRRQGDIRARFYLWPLYRWREQETDAFRYTRRDLLLVVGRDVEQVNRQSQRRRTLQTLFPLFRRASAGERARFSTLALLEALAPHNETILRLYQPLWQLYASDRDAGRPTRWSLLWDLVSSDGTRVSWPVGVRGES